MLSQKGRFPSLWLHSIPLCKCIPAHLLIRSSTDGCLGCFPTLVTVNNAAMNIEVLMFFRISVSGFFGYLYSQKWDCSVIR